MLLYDAREVTSDAVASANALSVGYPRMSTPPFRAYLQLRSVLDARM